MHANRNKKAVKRVEKGMMKANRIRNLFAVFAIVLTTFMITTVFSLGINYMENMKLMQVRTAGTTANASLAMPTEKQEQQIKNLEYVKTVGTQYMVGSVAEKNDEGRDLSIALSYYDPTEWEKHYKETIKDIEGKYPSDENEIMLSEDALSQLGMKEPKVCCFDEGTGNTFDLNRIQIAPLSNGKQGKGCYKGNAFGTALGYRRKLC